VIPLSRQARLLVAIAAVSFAAIVVVSLVVRADPQTRGLVAGHSITWSALYAAVCCGIAWRRLRGRPAQGTWLWVGAGCVAILLGQAVWSYYRFVLHVRLPYPSLGDVAYLGGYVCFGLAVVRLLRAEPRRRPDAEMILDTALVTFTAGTVTYEFLLAPLLAAGGTVSAILTSIAWASGGVAVLWLILVQMLRRARFPLATAGPIMAGLALSCVANVLYAAGALGGTVRGGGALHLGWDAGLLLLGTAAAVTPERTDPGDHAVSTTSYYVARIIAVAIGLVGILAVAVAAAVRPEPSAVTAVLVGAGIALLAVRFAYLLRVDRRYAELLEQEVANQTRSLMDSLAAAATAERNLRLVMESVPDAITVLDREGRVTELNPPARAMMARQDELQPGSAFDSLDADAAKIVRAKLAAAFQGEVQRFDLPFLRGDGTKGYSTVVYAPVRESGRVTRVLALARDVTDQKRTESQLQQAEKLAAMGQLVSGVAHEINNPAAIISGFAQTLLLDELKPEHREMVQMVYDEATRIGRITSNLLAFARAGSRQRSLVDVNDLVRRTFALRSYHLSTLNITVLLELDPLDPKIWADASELQQLLLNLLINAEQALMTIERTRTIIVRSGANETEVRLEVADSGPGIGADIHGKIFDPFFTTKPEGLGTGLGLSICYGIAREHGGRIWVESEPGKGATFILTIPRDPRQEGRQVTAPPLPPKPATAPLAVLVIDDETALRNALLRFLQRRGIQGEGVSDGAEALRVLKERDFHVIISDVRMPGMAGREFIQRLRRDRPELVARLIFSTGDTFAPDTAALLQEVGVPTVTKPFDFAALERVVREVAAQGARPQASA